jgi:hypothetical protein
LIYAIARLVKKIGPCCPKCGSPIRLSIRQYVECKSCGAILEDDRGYNMNLYLIFLTIVMVVASVAPLYLAIPVVAVLVLAVVGNMRFIEKSGD